MEDRQQLIGRRILAAQPVATAHDDRFALDRRIVIRRADIRIKRLADRAALLRPIQHRNFFDRRGDRVEEMLDRERAIKMNVDHANLLAARVEIIRRLERRLAHRADRYDNPLRVGRAVIVEQMMLAPRDLRHVRHRRLNDIGQLIIIPIDCLAHLEINVGIGRRAANDGMIGIERAPTERVNRIVVDNLCKVGVIDRLDLLNLMRSSEAVEEIDERYAPLDRRQVSHRRQIHDFLHTRLGKHRATRLACRHHVLVIAENVQCRSRQRPRAHVKHARQHFARYFIQVRDHQQKTLRRGVSRRQRAGLQRAVNGARSSALGLQLDQTNLLPENIFGAARRHLVNVLRHRRRRRDRINRRNFGERITDVCGGLVAVHGLHLFTHVKS